MNGLYRKASQLKDIGEEKSELSAQEEPEQPLAEFVPPDEVPSDITLEEQVEIIAEIDGVVEKTRTRIDRQTFAFRPQRNGALVPLVVNVAAVAAVVVGVAVLLLFFNRQERTLTSPAVAVLSAESRLIAAVRQESEQQLAQKDQEIGQIQDRLSQLRRQQEELRSQTADQLRQREEQMRRELEQRLDSERRRLEQQGLSEQSVSERLGQLEEQLQAANAQQLAAYRQEAEQALADKQAELDALRQAQQSSLQSAQEERARLEADRSRIAAQFDTLQEQRREEQRAFDQILAFYAAVDRALGASEHDRALESLDALERFLDQPGIASLPAVQRRLPAERFVMRTVRRLVAAESAPAPAAAPPAETTTGPQTAELQGEIADLRGRLEQEQSRARSLQEQLDRQQRTLSRQEALLAEQRQRSQQVTGIRSAYAAAAAGLHGEGPTQEELLSLLETKVLVRQIVSSDSVRRQHPALYESLEQFFTISAEEQWRQGQEDALQDVNAVLEAVLADNGLDAGELAQRYAGSSDQFTRFLAGLQRLLR